MLKDSDPAAYEKLEQKLNRTRLVRAIEKARNPVQEKLFLPLENIEFLVMGTFYPRPDVRARIRARLESRLAVGMLDEVSSLHKNGLSWERLEYFGLEYRWLARHLQGQMSYKEMLEGLYIKICDFAKSQDVWFRKMEREGVSIHWFRPLEEAGHIEQLAEDFLADRPLPAPLRRMSEIHYGPMSSIPPTHKNALLELHK